MKRRDIINLIILIAVILVGLHRYFYRVRSFSETRFLLDTIITIKIETKEKNGEEFLNEAFELIAALEDKLSFYKEGGTLWNFNEDRTSQLKMNRDMQEIISIAGQLYRETDASYDISIGRLSELWDFDKQRIPAADSIQAALNFVGFDNLIIDENSLQKPAGFKLNLGSLAKGFIVDKVVKYLDTEGITTGYINAGGDIRIFGQKKTLKIGIQHPRKANGEIIAKLKIKDKSIVTSGDYERYFIKDDQRYHHILDPRTGNPSRNAASVTVIAEKAILADAYSTALFLMQPQKAIQLINNTADLEAVILVETDDGIEMLESAGMTQYKHKDAK